MTLIEIVNYRI